MDFIVPRFAHGIAGEHLPLQKDWFIPLLRCARWREWEPQIKLILLKHGSEGLPLKADTSDQNETGVYESGVNMWVRLFRAPLKWRTSFESQTKGGSPRKRRAHLWLLGQHAESRAHSVREASSKKKKTGKLGECRPGIPACDPSYPQRNTINMMSCEP